MPAPYSLSDLEYANAISKEIMGQFGPIGTKGDNVNTYEKTVIKSYMNIEYGAGASIEQLTMGYGYFGAVIDKVKAAGFDVPTDLQTAFDACERDLKIKIRDNRLKELRALEIQRTTHLSREDKLKNIDAEIARLKELTK